MFLPIRDTNPTRSAPVVNYLLIALNCAAWLFQLWMMATFGETVVVAGYGLVPSRITNDPAGEAFTVLTSMFMHGDWMHVGWNMVFLYIFGDNVEDAVGRGRYALLYVACGAAAALAQVLINPTSPIPMVGASGAIAGMLGAYLVLYPRAPVTVFNTFFPLWFVLPPILVFPAWLVVGEWFIGNLFGGLGALAQQVQGGRDGSMVAFFAHLGGFVAGLLLIRPSMTGRRKVEVDAWHGWRPPPRRPPPGMRASETDVFRDARPRPGRWDPWN
jgi:membrane associated rhomboid family serine protease